MEYEKPEVSPWDVITIDDMHWALSRAAQYRTMFLRVDTGESIPFEESDIDQIALEASKDRISRWMGIERGE